MWLARAQRAAKMLDYDATFVLRAGKSIETFRIIHRWDVDGERERLVSLSGLPRDVLRDPSNVICVLRDTQIVFVGKRRPGKLDGQAPFAAPGGLRKFYRFSLRGTDRVAGRVTQRLIIEPADRYRYGYRLWLDEETGLLLKSEVVDETGKPLEQIVYTSVVVPARIPDALLQPAAFDKDLTLHTSDGDILESGQGLNPHWQLAWLPAGFEIADGTTTPVSSPRRPVAHAVYTDGLAVLSVFVENLASARAPQEGLARVGALNAFWRVIDGRQITVMGEVPPITVESAGRSITGRQP